jgi:hypothetical protein
MKVFIRSSVSLLFAIAALALPAGASGAPASTTFAISGNEYAFTSTVGSFAGVGQGNLGDRALWNTSVQHDPLGSVPTYINGGSFQMATWSPTGHIDSVTGTFVHHGGTITPKPPVPNGTSCPNQQFQVTGALQDVATRTSSGGSGAFSATLTHYRFPLFGQCVIYNARIAGAVSFTY